MKTHLLGVIAALAMLGTSPATAGIVYTLTDTIGPLTVTGTITTDGNIGILSAADITGYNLTFSGGTSTPFTLTHSNSSLSLIGPSLSATTSNLMFNYSNNVSISRLDFFNAPYELTYLDAAGTGGLGDNFILTNNTVDQASVTGNPIIATASAVPAPTYGAGLPGLIFALGGLFFWFRRSQRARNNFSAAGSMTPA